MHPGHAWHRLKSLAVLAACACARVFAHGILASSAWRTSQPPKCHGRLASLPMHWACLHCVCLHCVQEFPEPDTRDFGRKLRSSLKWLERNTGKEEVEEVRHP